MTAVQATGKIKLYQSVVGGILLLNVPVSWIALLMGAPPYSVVIVAIGMTIIASIARLLILKRLIDYSIREFFKIVLTPIFIITIISAILPVILYTVLVQNILRLCLVVSLSIFSVTFYSYRIGLNKEEQQKVRSIIRKYVGKKE
jgi:hypothetical protein